MFRLLEKGVEDNFEDDQINLSHVAALIKKNRTNEVIIPQTNDPLYEELAPTVYSLIPPDLYWLSNARVEVIKDPYNCDTAPTLGTTVVNEFTCVVPFPAASGTAPYFSNLIISSNIIGIIYTAPSPLSNGFNSSNSAYVISNNVLDTLYSSSTLKCYWERYRDVYYKNSFIFVASTPLGTISINGTNLTPTSGIASSTAYIYYNRSLIPAITNKKVTLAPVKVQEQDGLYSAQKENQFYKSRSNEVSMDQTHDYFILYRDESFIVTRMAYDYIRKPRTISLNLNQSCELADTTHPKIVDLAVEILRLDIKDQSYPATVQDTQLRT